MKRIIFISLSLTFAASCSDYLETSSTDSVSGTEIFASDQAALTAINGAYALLWRTSFVSGNSTHAIGHQSTLLAEDLMADDMVQMAFNWFGPDYALEYTSVISISNASRSYNLWNMYYTLISNANYIIAEDGQIGANSYTAQSVVAQAYALRAFSYFELVQVFQKTYLGHELDPGVPIYTLPTRAGDEGKPRGTVADVYAIINSDLERAIEIFTDIDKPRQEHCSHIDYYVARGLQARVALVQGRWQEASDAARDARSCLSVKVLPPADLSSGMSDKSLATSLWAMEVITDQSSIYGSIYCFLDARTSTAYGYGQRKCISSWLYRHVAKFGAADARTAWFYDEKQGSASNGDRVNYGQKKRLARVLASWVGDVIFMRGEELLLVEAEAKVRVGRPDSAIILLQELAKERLTTDSARTAYTALLNGLNTAVLVLPDNTNTDPKSVLEEVL
ncbi:MAG: RagB/SusD family nutrient uptake outer membrane protein, partial [Prevotellaceae bacterium]|nr:RagB/SusD family nutrient uptake outer membrane protein [Prevotellaceae bacterium]